MRSIIIPTTGATAPITSPQKRNSQDDTMNHLASGYVLTADEITLLKAANDEHQSLQKRNSENVKPENTDAAPKLKKSKSSEVRLQHLREADATPSGIAATVQDYVEAGKLTGCNLCVFGPDDVKVSGAFGDHEPSNIYPLYSLTKTFTGVAVLQLIEKGMLALDEPVATYLPSFARERREGAEGFSVAPQSVTIRHCLTHTAGFTYFLNCVHPHKFMSAHEAAEAGHFGAALGRTLTEKPMDSLEWANEFQASCALMFEPGTHFNYSEGSNVLSAVVEKLTGKPFSQYLAEEILGPVGAKEVGFECADYGRMPTFRIAERYKEELAKFLDDEQRFDLIRSDAASRGDVGLKGTTTDLVLYGQMLLRGGKAADGTTVLGEKAFQLATSNLLPGDKTLEPPFAFGAPPSRAPDAPGHFGATAEEFEEGRAVNFFPGMGWSAFGGLVLDPKASGLPENAKGVIWWQGVASTYLAVNPASGVGVVLMASEGIAGDHQAFFGELIAAAHKML